MTLATVVKVVKQRRSWKWLQIRADYLRRNNVCRACGNTTNLEVHHIIPFHLRPDLELVQSNLITLCEKGGRNCHFALGHLLDWKAYNPSVIIDSYTYLIKLKERRYAE